MFFDVFYALDCLTPRTGNPGQVIVKLRYVPIQGRGEFGHSRPDHVSGKLLGGESPAICLDLNCFVTQTAGMGYGIHYVGPYSGLPPCENDSPYTSRKNFLQLLFYLALSLVADSVSLVPLHTVPAEVIAGIADLDIKSPHENSLALTISATDSRQ